MHQLSAAPVSELTICASCGGRTYEHAPDCARLREAIILLEEARYIVHRDEGECCVADHQSPPVTVRDLYFYEAGRNDAQDAPDVWDGSLPPGGYVCGGCGQPTESDPCREHQPRAWREGGYDEALRRRWHSMDSDHDQPFESCASDICQGVRPVPA
jgi:hypothetical protein